MFFLVSDNFLKLFLTVNLVCFVAASEELKDDNIDRGSRSGKEGGMWYGPRLGKRSLIREDDRQTYQRLLQAADALKFYYDQLQWYDEEDEPRVSKKIMLTPKLGRSLGSDKRYESVDFTPRLGRRLADDMPATPPDREFYRPDPEQIDSRTKYFSPRLGRTMSFSPRLGRELAYEMFPDKLRMVRSTKDAKAT